MELLGRVDVLMVNDSEARELSGDWNIHRAGRWILAHGPKRVVIKQGEHGALLIEPTRTFYVPAFPLENVFDPTGAGDAFAGGFMAYLARAGSVSEDNIRRAMVVGATMGSYAVEQFGIRGFEHVTLADVAARVRRLRGPHAREPRGGARVTPAGEYAAAGVDLAKRGRGEGADRHGRGRHADAALGGQGRRLRRDGAGARRACGSPRSCSAPTASAPRCSWRSRPDGSTPWARTSSTTASTTSWSTARRRSRSWTTSRARGSASSRSPGWSRASRAAAAPTAWRSPAARRRRCRASTSRAPTTSPGTIIGVVEEDEALHGDAIVPGDVLLGYASTGLHTNGYTLARRIVFERMGLGLDDALGDTGRTRGRRAPGGAPELRDERACRSSGAVHGLAHITGGGIAGNLVRVLPAGLRGGRGSGVVAAAAALRRAAAGRRDLDRRDARSLQPRRRPDRGAAAGRGGGRAGAPPAPPASRPGRWARSAEAARPCGSRVPDGAGPCAEP